MAPITNFMTPVVNLGACVLVFMQQKQNDFLCPFVSVYVCLRECVKVGGGTVWENTPVCGLTKLSFCT